MPSARTRHRPGCTARPTRRPHASRRRTARSPTRSYRPRTCAAAMVCSTARAAPSSPKLSPARPTCASPSLSRMPPRPPVFVESGTPPASTACVSPYNWRTRGLPEPRPTCRHSPWWTRPPPPTSRTKASYAPSSRACDPTAASPGSSGRRGPRPISWRPSPRSTYPTRRSRPPAMMSSSSAREHFPDPPTGRTNTATSRRRSSPTIRW